MSDQSRWLKRILPGLLRQGWKYRYSGNHVMLYPAEPTQTPFPVSMTPSDNYAQNNAKKDILKRGGRI